MSNAYLYNYKYYNTRIEGLSPSVFISNKSYIYTYNSSVGSLIGLYDYIKLLFYYLGCIYSPISKQKIIIKNYDDIIKYIYNLPLNSNVTIFSHINVNYNNFITTIKEFKNKGFNKIKVDNFLLNIDELIDYNYRPKLLNSCFLYIDTITLTSLNDSFLKNIFLDGVKLAIKYSFDYCVIYSNIINEIIKFYVKLREKNIIYKKIHTDLFDFNKSYGSCSHCQGKGVVFVIDKLKVISNSNLSLNNDCVSCWKYSYFKSWKQDFIKNTYDINFPIDVSYDLLSLAEKKLLWYGNDFIKGIYDFFKFLKQKSYNMNYKHIIKYYSKKEVCIICNGSRLCVESEWVRVDNHSISNILNKPISDLFFFYR